MASLKGKCKLLYTYFVALRPHGQAPWPHQCPITKAKWHKGVMPCALKWLSEPWAQCHGMCSTKLKRDIDMEQ